MRPTDSGVSFWNRERREPPLRRSMMTKALLMLFTPVTSLPAGDLTPRITALHLIKGDDSPDCFGRVRMKLYYLELAPIGH